MNELPEFGQVGFAGIKRMSVLNAGENREGGGGLGRGWRGQAVGSQGRVLDRVTLSRHYPDFPHKHLCVTAGL